MTVRILTPYSCASVVQHVDVLDAVHHRDRPGLLATGSPGGPPSLLPDAPAGDEDVGDAGRAIISASLSLATVTPWAPAASSLYAMAGILIALVCGRQPTPCSAEGSGHPVDVRVKGIEIDEERRGIEVGGGTANRHGRLLAQQRDEASTELYGTGYLLARVAVSPCDHPTRVGGASLSADFRNRPDLDLLAFR